MSLIPSDLTFNGTTAVVLKFPSFRSVSNLLIHKIIIVEMIGNPLVLIAEELLWREGGGGDAWLVRTGRGEKRLDFQGTGRVCKTGNGKNPPSVDFKVVVTLSHSKKGGL